MARILQSRLKSLHPPSSKTNITNRINALRKLPHLWYPRRPAVLTPRGDLPTALAIRASFVAGLPHSPTRHTPGCSADGAGQHVFIAQMLPPAQSSSFAQDVIPLHRASWPQNPAPVWSEKQKQSPVLQEWNPPSQVWLLGHWALEQIPLLQTPVEQTLPQLPQLLGSVWVLAVQDEIGEAEETVDVCVVEMVTVTVVASSR